MVGRGDRRIEGDIAKYVFGLYCSFWGSEEQSSAYSSTWADSDSNPSLTTRKN
jgi:hypothetical protein